MIKVQLGDFEVVFKQLVEKKQKCLMIFTSESDANGNYWCPDCQRIAPYYNQYEEQAKKAGLKLYIFIAGDRPTWKDPNHIFRKNPALKITSVPTMGKFDGKRLTMPLVEDEILNKKQRDLLFENSSL